MMQVQLGMEGDIPKRSQSAGTYEWWYFDAIDELQDLAITIILFDGMPMSPYWLEAMPNANAEDYRGYAISLYRNGKKIAGYVHHVNQHDIYMNDDELIIQMGDVTMQRTKDHVYKISIDTFFPHSTNSIKGVFSFTPITANNVNEHKGEGNHCWRLIAPMCEVQGELSIRQYQDESESLVFSGHGYHDCNSGDDALDADYDDWYWGRIPLDEHRTLIYYHYPPCSRHAAFSIAFIADSEHGIRQVEDCSIQLNDVNMTFSLMKIAQTIEISGFISGEPIDLKLTNVNTMEFGPFYYRYATVIQSPQSGSTPFHGISEYFNAHRLRSPLVRSMIKTPMQRV